MGCDSDVELRPQRINLWAISPWHGVSPSALRLWVGVRSRPAARVSTDILGAAANGVKQENAARMCGSAQMGPNSRPTLRAMSEAAQSEVDELHAAHASAMLAFNAASAVLILRLAANSVPTAEEIATEEEARAAVVATRRKLWETYS